jgi:hypothetical protein
MQGAGFSPYTPQVGGTFLDTLPAHGNCALGGCGDVHSDYADECVSQCGCQTPGCEGFPQAVHSNTQLAFSSTDCTIKGEACQDWRSFHNCLPNMPDSHFESMCK